MWKLLSFIVQKFVGLSYKFNHGYDAFNDALLERGLVIHHKDYYGPFVAKEDISKPLDEERNLPGLKLDRDAHEALISQFDYADELRQLPMTTDNELQFSFGNTGYGPGDSEMLYNFIRYLKPKRIIEVGAGFSTLMAQEAIKKNQQEDADYVCQHVCVEPYENAWLEKIGIEIVREKVEDLPMSFFQDLGENDILFIDSTHVVKPQGDVLYEIFDIYGSLNSGVYVHVHDIFTPRDYPREWVIDDRRLWHEQYLLEAFLSFNPDFQTVCALNWVWKNYPEMLKNACPILTTKMPVNVGSYWFKRV